MTEAGDYNKVRVLSARIDAETTKAESNWYDADILTQSSMKIAIYNAEMSKYVSVFHAEASHKTILEYQKSRKSGSTQKDAEMEAKLEALEDRKFYETVKAGIDSNERLMPTFRARLEYLLQENKRSNVKEGRFL